MLDFAGYVFIGAPRASYRHFAYQEYVKLVLGSIAENPAPRTGTLTSVPPKILVSAGEASGDLYASQLVTALRRIYPDADFFGCAGPRMRAAGVERC